MKSNNAIAVGLLNSVKLEKYADCVNFEDFMGEKLSEIVFDSIVKNLTL